MKDGSVPSPGGGWNRILLDFDDLDTVVEKPKANWVRFKNDILLGAGGKQVICEDPSGNVIELSQPTSADSHRCVRRGVPNSRQVARGRFRDHALLLPR